MQNDVLLESRSAALRQVLRSLECDAAAKTYLDGFVPSLPGTKPYVPVGAAGSRHLLSTLESAGSGFTIDSLADLESVVALGIDPRAVLYRKAETHADGIREAALRGVWRFAVDSERAMSTVANAAPGVAAYVYVAAPNSSSAGPSGTSAQEALRLLRMAPELGLRPYGLAFHIGSEDTDVATYALAIDRCGLVMRRLERFGTRLEMLGLGGVHGGDASDPAVLAALARLPYRPSLLAVEP